jgi:hypothetical protein
MKHVNEIIRICREILSGETFLEDSVIREILDEALELKADL